MSGIIERAQDTLGQVTAEATRKMQELHQNDKMKQLNHHKVDPSASSKFTANTGMGVANTDVWLKVAGDKQGPALLQDHHGREKVWITTYLSHGRFISSTMKEFRSVSFTHVELVLTVYSVYIKQFLNFPVLPC
jgi:hypothetical protein